MGDLVVFEAESRKVGEVAVFEELFGVGDLVVVEV